MSGDDSRVSEAPSGTGRVEAFSDAVIAIAITLLIIEVRVPEHDGTASGLAAALVHQWPSYLGYAISFLTIGVVWINHHNIFRMIGDVDQVLVVANLLLLLCIGFVPFPTAVLAESLGHPEQQAAVVFYSGWFAVTALCYTSVWFAASRDGGRLLARGVATAAVRRVSRAYLTGTAAYVGAFLVSFVLAGASVAALALLAVFFALPRASTA